MARSEGSDLHLPKPPAGPTARAVRSRSFAPYIAAMGRSYRLGIL